MTVSFGLHCYDLYIPHRSTHYPLLDTYSLFPYTPHDLIYTLPIVVVRSGRFQRFYAYVRLHFPVPRFTLDFRLHADGYHLISRTLDPSFGHSFWCVTVAAFGRPPLATALTCVALPQHTTRYAFTRIAAHTTPYTTDLPRLLDCQHHCLRLYYTAHCGSRSATFLAFTVPRHGSLFCGTFPLRVTAHRTLPRCHAHLPLFCIHAYTVTAPATIVCLVRLGTRLRVYVTTSLACYAGFYAVHTHCAPFFSHRTHHTADCVLHTTFSDCTPARVHTCTVATLLPAGCGYGSGSFGWTRLHYAARSHALYTLAPHTRSLPPACTACVTTLPSTPYLPLAAPWVTFSQVPAWIRAVTFDVTHTHGFPHRTTHTPHRCVVTGLDSRIATGWLRMPHRFLPGFIFAHTHTYLCPHTPPLPDPFTFPPRSLHRYGLVPGYRALFDYHVRDVLYFRCRCGNTSLPLHVLAHMSY